MILLNALTHAFVSLRDISLIVVDECHAAVKNNANNLIMQQFYHPLRQQEPAKVPCILGLTASPLNKDDLSLIQTLEQNLHAVCRTPTINIDEYKAHVFPPQLVRLDYEARAGNISIYLPRLESVVEQYDLQQDPQYRKLQGDSSLEGLQKFQKLTSKGITSVLEQLIALLNNASFMQHSIGAWATDCYILACTEKVIRKASKMDDWLVTFNDEELSHIQRLMQNVIGDRSKAIGDAAPGPSEMSAKVEVLASYLEDNHRQGSACILFVQRRSTAWALKQVLERLPKLSHCRLFTFVGMNASRSQIADLADKALQDGCFADFKLGKRDVCIATQVMEEGIDIMACDMVIDFDSPSTLKSFIQRRGRARRPNSRFVILHCPDDTSAKYQDWGVLEDAMKQVYTSRKRKLHELEKNEADAEQCNRSFRIDSTGALLTTDNSRQHLDHFSATLHRRTGKLETSPIYVCSGTHGHNLFCEVVLPISLPQALQTTRSLFPWRTETAAKKDAAFEAYKKLWRAGLVNDHLLPPKLEKCRDRADEEARDSVNEVPLAFDPWGLSMQNLQAGHDLFAHEIVLEGPKQRIPDLYLLLPQALVQTISSELFTSSSCKSLAHIHPVGDVFNVTHAQAIGVTKCLFAASLARRLPHLTSDEAHLPYYLVPSLQPPEIEEWLLVAETLCPLKEFPVKEGETYTLKRGNENTPYLYSAEETRAASQWSDEDEIQVTKLSRRLDFSKAAGEICDRHRSLRVCDCTVSGTPSAYVTLIAFIPTIMHQVELALRTQAAASETQLKSIGFEDLRLVQAALTAPGANGKDDFQRLEYLGDSLLKFHSTVNVFCNHPLAPESQLSLRRDDLLTNKRLQKATMDLGLDRYLSTKAFVGHEWTLAKIGLETNTTRKISSKTLADIIESLIGAAYMDINSGDEKVLRALSLFLPEITWRSPAADIADLPATETKQLSWNDRLSHVQAIIGHHFDNNLLLAEALTHSAVQSAVPSYERLEFLGDAVIDIIVKEALHKSKHEFSEGEMHSRAIALVNQDILAFLATKNGVDIEENVVEVDVRTQQPVVSKVVKRRCLHDFMVRLGSEEMTRQRNELMEGFTQAHEKIETSLQQGKIYAWSDVYGLASPKWCSDVFESIIGAVFVDSGGRLDTVRGVLDTLGFMHLLHKAVEEKEMDFRQPVRKMREWYAEKGMKVKIETQRLKGEGKQWRCRVKIEGEVKAMVKECGCEAEAQTRCAEIVLAALETMGELDGGECGDDASGDMCEEGNKVEKSEVSVEEAVDEKEMDQN